jgi:hypothetical protein
MDAEHLTPRHAEPYPILVRLSERVPQVMIRPQEVGRALGVTVDYVESSTGIVDRNKSVPVEGHIVREPEVGVVYEQRGLEHQPGS